MSEEQAVVFVVDDDPSMRRSLESLLRSIGHDVRLFSSAQEFMRAERPDAPGCLLLDVRLPGMSGLTFQQELSNAGIALPIIFITGHGDIPMAVEAVRQGAVDFIQKPFSDQELMDRIGDALEQATRQREGELERLDIMDRMGSLTAREREVMGQVVQGKANKVIAADLGVSQRTVEIHRARVMEKMQANSLAHLVRMVMVSENQPPG